MRFKFFLCASADLGVRRTNVSSSFCRSGYIVVLEVAQAFRPLDCGPSGRSRPELNQKKNFNANCTRRGSRTCVICPNCAPSEKLPSGLKNCVWLKMLKNSARKSTCVLSEVANVFRTAKSVWLWCGPQQMVRGEF